MADIAEIQLKIRAVEFALGTFADYEKEEERRNFLKQKFTAIPGLKTYFSFSETKLQDALSKLQEKENLLLAQQQGWSSGSVTGPLTTIIGEMRSPLSMKSPTNTVGDHLTTKGLALFIRRPLSLDISGVAGHPMLVNVDDLPFCPVLGNDKHVSTLPLDETEYYDHFSRYSLSGIQESTRKPGKKVSAGKLFP
eukprot:gene45176-55263_t